MTVKKGDLVTVISGNEKGKSGRILHVFPEKKRIIVEKVNMAKRHQRASKEFPQGGIMEKELSINASNVMLVCPRCGQITRIGKKKIGKGKSVRSCKKCGEVVDEQK